MSGPMLGDEPDPVNKSRISRLSNQSIRRQLKAALLDKNSEKAGALFKEALRRNLRCLGLYIPATTVLFILNRDEYLPDDKMIYVFKCILRCYVPYVRSMVGHPSVSAMTGIMVDIIMYNT